MGFNTNHALVIGQIVRLADRSNAAKWVQARVIHVSPANEAGTYRAGVEFVFGTDGVVVEEA